MPDIFKCHEVAKKWAYDQRIREVEHVTLTLLVFFMISNWSLGCQANIIYND